MTPAEEARDLDLLGWGLNGRSSLDWIGARAGLLDWKHIAAMGSGSALWLYLWCIRRQTTESNGSGLVLGGKPLSYADIAIDMGCPRSHAKAGKTGARLVRRWLGRLRQAGYVEVKHSVYGKLVLRVLKAKKFGKRQLSLPGFPHDKRISTAPPRGYIAPPESNSSREKKNDTEMKTRGEPRRAAFPPLTKTEKALTLAARQKTAQGVERKLLSEAEQCRRIEARDRRLVAECESRSQGLVGLGPGDEWVREKVYAKICALADRMAGARPRGP